MYANFEALLNERGVKVSDVSKATGIRQSVFSDWKAGRYTPKTDKVQQIADFFGVSIERITSGTKPPAYYLNPETAAMAQTLFEQPGMRILFDAARDSKPEDLAMAADLLRRLKETNPDG